MGRLYAWRFGSHATCLSKFKIIGTTEAEHFNTKGVVDFCETIHQVVGVVQMRNRKISWIPLAMVMVVENSTIYVLIEGSGNSIRSSGLLL